MSVPTLSNVLTNKKNEQLNDGFEIASKKNFIVERQTMKAKTLATKRKMLTAAISLSMLPLAGATFAQGTAVEEVVVTGSFIRRTEGFRNASPITQIGVDDIAAAGTPNMGDVIHNLSFNQGSSITQNSFTGASSQATGMNLRGLGEGATLTLIDGKRTVDNNVNTFLPQIAIQRLDIVTDGAAALYGSQAVAGVVNFVPMKSYDGLKLETMHQGDDRGDYEDTQISALYGTEWNGINIVLAADYRNNGTLEMNDRPDQVAAGLTSSSTPNPGRFRIPQRDENGQLTGDLSGNTSDPNCGGARQFPYEDLANPNGFTFGGNCWFDFGQFWDYRAAQQAGSAFANFSYDVSPELSWNAQFGFYNRKAQNRGSPSNPGGRTSELPVIRGEQPGNPYRAVDANGNPLFAADANGDGVPDRNAAGVVQLDPTGIPFNEDVLFGAWRPVGISQTLPAQHADDGAIVGDTDITGYRAAFDVDFAVPVVEGWEGRASYLYNRRNENNRQNNFSFNAIVQGLSCDVVNDADACFNPFAPIPGQPDTYNTQAVADSLVVQNRDDNNDTLQTFDLIINGELPLGGFELPGGAIGAAFGYQRRDESFDQMPAVHSLANDQFIGAQLVPVSDGRTVDSYFAEFSAPLLDNLELQVAVRNEDYSTGQSSTDPKYGLVYSPADFMTLRASMGTSFIAPTLDQLNAPESCGLTNVADPFTTFAAFTASCSAGNPALTPESADTMAFGFTWDIMDGMRLDVDYSETDFADRIVDSTTADILALDFFNFQNAFGAVPAGQLPSLDQVRQWVADPRSDKRIVRNAGNIEQIDRVTQGETNASSMLVQAVDIKFNYQFELGDGFGLGKLLGTSELGSMSLAVNATYIDDYTYQLSADRDVVDAKGKQNDLTGATPPIPEWKGNVRIGWVKGQHSFNISADYIDSVIFDANKFSFQRFLPFSTYENVDVLRASTIANAAYNYRQFEAMGGELSFTVGARNLFDRLPQKVPMLGGNESIMYDPTGRMVYARLTYEM